MRLTTTYVGVQFGGDFHSYNVAPRKNKMWQKKEANGSWKFGWENKKMRCFWNKNIIQKYEDRLANNDDLKNICLANFATKYTLVTESNHQYRRRKEPRILRSVQYDISKLTDYKQEIIKQDFKNLTKYFPVCENILHRQHFDWITDSGKIVCNFVN